MPFIFLMNNYWGAIKFVQCLPKVEKDDENLLNFIDNYSNLMSSNYQIDVLPKEEVKSAALDKRIIYDSRIFDPNYLNFPFHVK